VAGWTKGVGNEREKLAGRPRPLRSRNDIKVFQELSVRDTPYPTSQFPHTLLIPYTAFPLPRLGLLFKGGFQGCGVPINNSLSFSLTRPLSRRTLHSSLEFASDKSVPPLSTLHWGTFSKWRRPPSLHSGKSQMRCNVYK